MAFRFNITLFVIMCSSFALQAHKDEPFIMRVLLRSLDIKTAYTLESKTGFSVWDTLKPAHTMKSSAHRCILQRTVQTGLLCNGKQVMPQSLMVKARKGGHITFDGKTYQGTFLVMQTQSAVYLINCLDLEDYIFSVLKTESWPGWPLEVNKVFAIACRSYALSMAMQARKLKKPYDVKNSNVHQTYSGVHKCSVIKKAVEQTRGVFLSYNKQPITAMFDCCCGGVIPAHMDGVNFNDAPYLARRYPCLHCQSCSLFSWKCEYDVAFLENEISMLHGRIKRLRDITITRFDKAGLVKQVQVRNGTKQLMLSGQQMYSLLKDVKSFCFKAKRRGTKIIIDGKGYGHHLGLCQWGARQMVRDGHDYRQILLFYYPQTSFMRLM